MEPEANETSSSPTTRPTARTALVKAGQRHAAQDRAVIIDEDLEVRLGGNLTAGDGLAQGRVVALVLSDVGLGEPGERDVGDVTATEIAGNGDPITRAGMRAREDVCA